VDTYTNFGCLEDLVHPSFDVVVVKQHVSRVGFAFGAYRVPEHRPDS
jgi:hypothetical protein